jgi:hypothetical protein
MNWFLGVTLFVIAAYAGALPLLFILACVFFVLYAFWSLCRFLFRVLRGVS